MTTQTVIHPLLNKPSHKMKKWAEWQTLWNNSNQFEVLHSLLHFGFDVYATFEESVERIQLYCRLAESYGDHHCRQPLESDEPLELRRELSLKAYKVLCNKLCKEEMHLEHRPPSWISLINFKTKFAETIFGFFKTYDRGDSYGISNLRLIPESKKAESFLLSLCEIGLGLKPSTAKWYFSRNEESYQKKVEENLKPFLGEIIDALAGLGQLDTLLNKWITDATPLFPILEKKILQLSLHLPREDGLQSDVLREPHTIEEAVLGNSQMARILIALRIKKTEAKRWEGMYPTLK